MTEYAMLKNKSILGVIWNFIERISVRLVSFVIMILLARLLSPDDFGIIGMVVIFLNISAVITDSGITSALIQKQNRTEKDFSTAFFFNVVIGILLYFILFVSAPLISRFYGVSFLVPIIRVLCIVVIVNSLVIVQNTQLRIAMNFKRIFIINFISILISGVIAIIAVNNDLGVWSLVIYTLFKASIAALLFWLFGGWYPRYFFSFEAFKGLFSFGSKLLISGIYATIINNLYNVVIGRNFQQVQLGYYTKAREFGEVTSGTLSSAIQAVSFPLLADT